MTDQLLTIRHQPFDYQYMKDLFWAYRYPRNKISKLLNSGEIISLKSGLYVLSERFGRRLVPELAANLIYGPSYVSLDYALSRFGLIPEAAFNVTSVTTGRKKSYHTAVGTFSYQQIKPGYFSQAYLLQRVEDASFLQATAEKALCDKLYLAPKLGSISALEQYLFEDLRIDSPGLSNLDKKLISHLAEVSGKHNLRLLKEILK